MLQPHQAILKVRPAMFANGLFLLMGQLYVARSLLCCKKEFWQTEVSE